MAAEALNNTFTAFGPKPATQRRAQEAQETVQVDYSQVEDLCANELTLEESLKEYVGTQIWEAIEEGRIENADVFSETFMNDLLEWGIGEDEENCRQILTQLYNSLKDIGLFEQFKSDSQKKKDHLKVGLNIMAKYYEDDQYYEAKILSIEEDESYWIAFTDYGNEEQVYLDDIHILDAPEATAEELAYPVHLSDVDKVVEQCSDKLFDLMYVNQFRENLNFQGRDLSVMTNETLMNKDQKRELKKQKEKKKKFDPRQYQTFLKQSVQEEWFDLQYQTQPKDIRVDDYTLYTLDEAHILLEDVSLNFREGGKYGLVGKNGCGKTTLLRRISRYDIEELPKYIRVMHIEQEITGDDTPILETVMNMDVVYEKLNSRQKELEEADEDDEEATAELNDIINKRMELGLTEEESAERAIEILEGLQFTEAMLTWPTKQLSGGWRMRVSLAGALLVNPDVLMLDEPTNHLDFPSVVWLENYLMDYQGTLIIVSHDRDFLSNVVDTIVEVDGQALKYYRGDFDSYQQQKEEEFRRRERQYKDYKNEMSRIQEFVQKYRADKKRAAQVQSRIKHMRNMEEIACPTKDKIMRFDIPGNETQDEEVCRFIDVVFGYYSNKLIFRKINIRLDLHSRIGLIGANGAGKSTLVKLVLRHLTELFGEVRLNRHCRIAAFFQHHIDSLDLSLSAVDFFYQTFQDDLKKENRPEQAIRSRLGKFHITGDLSTKPMAVLSGGQKSRVAFALMCWKTPDFIIMDEPTNHLDMETCDALINALQRYPGGLLCVSHDQYFLQNVCTEFWTLDAHGKIHVFRNFAAAKKEALKVKNFQPHTMDAE